jgi:hypothetical protein
MKRPVPIVLSAILLGLLGAFQLLCAVLMVVVGLMALNKGLPGPQTATPMPFPPSWLPILYFAMSLLLAAFAAWFILTLIGLVRMRSWARYSVLAIAGLMAALGGISMVASFAMPFLMPAMPTAANQPVLDPAMMRGVFFVTGAIYGVFTAIGAALLVYFNLARTRALFLQNAPVDLRPPNTSTGRPRPTAVTVISWIYLISAPFCLIYAFLPFPAFLFGFMFYGWAARCVYAFFGILTLAIGYGLFRLREEARMAVYAMFAFLPIQVVVLLTPWGSRQFRLCMDAIDAAMFAGQQAAPNPFGSPGAVIFFLLLTMVFYGVAIWLLHRHRVAFTPAPTPPPMPPQPELMEGLTP